MKITLAGGDLRCSGFLDATGEQRIDARILLGWETQSDVVKGGI
jgi:hypothetical protein